MDISAAAPDTAIQEVTERIYRFTCAVAINGTIMPVNKSVSEFGDLSEFPADEEVPSFPIAINGFEVGIPVQAADIAFNSGIELSEVQIWVGQYIDPATNIDNFISGGRPVNPSVATAAFGTPTYLFSGNAEGFIVNQGDGGDFDKTGTVSDYTGRDAREREPKANEIPSPEAMPIRAR